MAYLRYSGTCEWYVFENGDELLAVWHRDFRALDTRFGRNELAKMLKARAFDQIPGYRPEHAAELAAAFSEWLSDPIE
jgi:hypothetical protein